MQGILKVTVSKFLTIKFQNNTAQKNRQIALKKTRWQANTTQTKPSLKKNTHTHQQYTTTAHWALTWCIATSVSHVLPSESIVSPWGIKNLGKSSNRPISFLGIKIEADFYLTYMFCPQLFIIFPVLESNVSTVASGIDSFWFENTSFASKELKINKQKSSLLVSSFPVLYFSNRWFLCTSYSKDNQITLKIWSPKRRNVYITRNTPLSQKGTLSDK